jgi:hypothetical protein
MPDVFETLMQDAPAPLSNEVDSRQTDMMDEMGMSGAMDSKIKAALQALYGPAFPLLSTNPTAKDWVSWAQALWDRHRAGVVNRLHLVERNRLFRRSIQWISSVGGVGWREPPKPRDAARVVFNMIAPALDMRAQIISEQRPGFKTRPVTQDPDDIKKAEAKQYALEYQWDQQDMGEVTREAVYWSGTDGACFLESYWDAEAGPWHEAFGVDEATGEKQPLGPDGSPVPPGPDGQPGQPHKFPLGDVKTIVRRIEQIRVSAEATSIKKPWYWVVRDVMPHAEAVRKYGLEVAEIATTSQGADGEGTINYAPQGYLLPDENELMRDQESVVRFTVYCEKSEYLPKGLTLVVVGDTLVFQGPLLTGVVPLVRWTDGSTDPSFFPMPIMDGWLAAQMRINNVLSKWVENIRLNAGPKLLAKRNALVGETLLGGTMTVIEAKGIGGLNDIIKPLDGFSLAADVKEFLMFEIRNFENLSGWNDTSRGQFSSEQSGRAILAIREQLERIFSPPVNAGARAMTEWSKVSCAFMKWGYDIPRVIGVEGVSRPDLARSLSSEDFDGATDVFIDAETLMPLPRALRLQLLDNMFDKGQMDAREYRRRLPFAFVRNLEYPDEVHFARAQRAVESLRQGTPIPVLYQDDEAIHIDVLNRELILQDNEPMELRAAAFQRWTQLMQQAAQKSMAAGGAPSPPPSGKPGGSPSGSPSPTTQPFAGTNPGIAAGTYQTAGGETDQRRAGREFDQQQHNQGQP